MSPSECFEYPDYDSVTFRKCSTVEINFKTAAHNSNDTTNLLKNKPPTTCNALTKSSTTASTDAPMTINPPVGKFDYIIITAEGTLLHENKDASN